MLIYLGADHRGFQLKEDIKKFLEDGGYETVDFGNSHWDKEDDYVDFALEVAERVSRDFIDARGILICGSGVGMDVVANRFKNIRASLCFSTDQAMAARNDDDANILVLPADFIEDKETAKRIVSVWMQTKFDGKPNHSRRLQKIADMDLKGFQAPSE